MKFVKYFLFLVLVVSAGTLSCKKSILSDDPGTIENKNIKLQIFPYWGSYYYNPDSLYFAGGAFIKIDEISIVHSDFYFVNAGDTLPASDPVEWKLTSGEFLDLAYLEPGSYTGFYEYIVGVDSAANFYPPQLQPKESVLNTNTSLYRGPGKGYNFITITGRIQDPNKPGTEPSIPMKWVVANNGLQINYFQPKSFNVAAGKDVTFAVVLQIEQLFNGLYPIVTPQIKADATNQADMDNTEVLQQNFKNAYLVQI